MNGMIDQVRSLPEMIQESIHKFDDEVRTKFSQDFCTSIKRLIITGCGDSHHTALTTELSFETLAGVPVEPMTAMQFSRYAAATLPVARDHAVIGISVSGGVSRTVEALRLAEKAGAMPIALTATPDSKLAATSRLTLFSTTAPFPPTQDLIIPGIRTYAANQLALLLLAVHMGEMRGALTTDEADLLRRELHALAEEAEKTIAACDEPARQLAQQWSDALEFVFAGSGPNYGTALFSAAKILEASGDPALGQDLEEWAHLQFFAKAVTTPTFLISAGQRDLSRAIEVAEAASAIGRRVVVIAPHNIKEFRPFSEVSLPLPEGVREMFSPLLAAIPGELFAAYRAEATGEAYFRGFSGPRNLDDGGINRVGKSEIRDEFHE